MHGMTSLVSGSNPASKLQLTAQQLARIEHNKRIELLRKRCREESEEEQLADHQTRPEEARDNNATGGFLAQRLHKNVQ
tara:strand:+ start:1000 stop:1236 length:237 start_codon:yes stop_codon:yes gene_type:complete